MPGFGRMRSVPWTTALPRSSTVVSIVGSKVTTCPADTSSRCRATSPERTEPVLSCGRRARSGVPQPGTRERVRQGPGLAEAPAIGSSAVEPSKAPPPRTNCLRVIMNRLAFDEHRLPAPGAVDDVAITSRSNRCPPGGQGSLGLTEVASRVPTHPCACCMPSSRWRRTAGPSSRSSAWFRIGSRPGRRYISSCCPSARERERDLRAGPARLVQRCTSLPAAVRGASAPFGPSSALSAPTWCTPRCSKRTLQVGSPHDSKVCRW